MNMTFHNGKRYDFLFAIYEASNVCCVASLDEVRRLEVRVGLLQPVDKSHCQCLPIVLVLDGLYDVCDELEVLPCQYHVSILLNGYELK